MNTKLNLFDFLDWLKNEWVLYAQSSGVDKPTVSLLCSLNGSFRVMVNDKIVMETNTPLRAMNEWNQRVGLSTSIKKATE